MKPSKWKPWMTEVGLSTVWIWFCLGSFFWTLLVVLSFFGIAADAAGWAQAIGTVAAVFAAIWTVRQQQAAERQKLLFQYMITAKGLTEMARQATHYVTKLGEALGPSRRAEYEKETVRARLGEFQRIDLLSLPDTRMVDQVMLVIANLEYAIQCADLVTELVDREAAQDKLESLKAISVILHGAWLNFRILQGHIETRVHTTYLNL
ncbi:hypothetical protein [Pseudomonas peli]|uniref:hypothetical protein n=2 Tax=Pseudomonas peli TaxID=592361 RepID=UPI001ABFF2CA|nr:hypothetical protein [Pseudomonas peli]